MVKWYKYFVLLILLSSCKQKIRKEHNNLSTTVTDNVYYFDKMKIVVENIDNDEEDNLKINVTNSDSSKYYFTINSDTFYIFDLNKNFKPEIAFIPKFGNPLQLIELPNNGSDDIKYINLPDEDLVDYLGKDEIQLTDSVIVRKYPLMKNQSDTMNISFKTLYYKLSKTSELYQN
ncbi:MAG: hypothetical protein IPL95_10015 [Saprospiraceae bacterium]|nr:hypothetical protein [Saprospiraceae bacterium]